MVTVRLDETTRRALITTIFETRFPLGESEILRAVEVTIVVTTTFRGRYPAKRELQLKVSFCTLIGVMMQSLKMHGLGNDFMVVDAVTQNVFFTGADSSPGGSAPGDRV